MNHNIQCPNCKRPAIYSIENPYRPFCCERCKIIDLGAWADEKFRVPDHTTPAIPTESGENNDDFNDIDAKD